MKPIIPIFPVFRLFTKEDIGWYSEYYYENKLCPYVDIHPNDILIWLNMNSNLEVAKLDESIVFKYSDVFNENKINVIPLKNSLDDNIIEKIMIYLEHNRLPKIIREIPRFTCENINKEKWHIEDDRDGYEYMLDVEKHAKLEGSDFSRQRRRIGFFEREHAQDEIEVAFYNEINDEIRQLFINHLDSKQLNSNAAASEKNKFEKKAIMTCLENSKLLDKKGLAIRINGEVVSLTMMCDLGDRIFAINNIKVDYSIQYIFQYTIHVIAKILSDIGYKEMNIEQDLGIEGIRTFKERLLPSRLLEKVNIISR